MAQEIQKSPSDILAEACDAALNDQIKLNEEQLSLNSQLKTAAIVKQERIEQLEREKSAWYNRPELLGLLGLAAGLIAGGIIAK